MGYHVKLSDRALRDLAGIYDFVKATTSERALSWFRELEGAIYRLELYPERGKPLRDRKKRRVLLFGKRPGVYRIIYETDSQDAVVKVFHIRHGARL